jgi:hypothetical protein
MKDFKVAMMWYFRNKLLKILALKSLRAGRFQTPKTELEHNFTDRKGTLRF